MAAAEHMGLPPTLGPSHGSRKLKRNRASGATWDGAGATQAAGIGAAAEKAYLSLELLSTRPTWAASLFFLRLVVSLGKVFTLLRAP